MEQVIVPRWIVKTLGILLIVLLAVMIINQLKAINGNRQTMNITAQGKVTSVPDLATIRIGVLTEGVNIVDVKNKNNQKINQLIDFITQQKIDKNDIQTTEFYASPKYRYDNGQSSIIGYSANQMMTVKFRDIDKSRQQLEKVLEGAVNNGANQIQDINFSFSQPDNLKKQARKQAIDKAKERARELTGQAGLRLGKVINIVETSDYSNQPSFSVAISSNAKSIAPDIQPGTQDIVENVTLVFEVN